MTTAQKALVLGGATGLVGQALAEVLLASNWKVRSAGRADLDFAANDAAQRLEALLDSARPDCVFNAIGYTQVDAAEEDEEAATLMNRTLPAMLGRIVKERGCALVHFSTDFVFDGKKQSPYTPEDPTNPLSVYGRTKLAGEEAILALDLPKCLIIRTAWLFGPGRNNFVSRILELCRAKGSINVVHDQIGSPTYTLDLAQYSLKLLESGSSGLFHIVNSGQARWVELADEAVDLAGLECTVNAVPSAAYPQKAERPAYSVLDCSALTKATGISPRPWPQALREFIFREFSAADPAP
ncbi:dTDP-4-dehydrorhamnose reductase [Desulfovibrio sp. OttesenSCG-928-A18]|nr:dTDP-4-dehydrorhamnose reductase [Desulfovibrio sp. OttesenSCG-928-A18]